MFFIFDSGVIYHAPTNCSNAKMDQLNIPGGHYRPPPGYILESLRDSMHNFSAYAQSSNLSIPMAKACPKKSSDAPLT